MRELAGLLFEIGRYTLSAKLYKKAIELDPDNLILYATYGDALMYSGNYKEAKENFDYFLLDKRAKNKEPHEWQLKYTVLATLIEFDYPKSQIRQPLEALKLIATKALDKLRSKDELLAIFELDLLNEFAWSQMSIHFYNEQDINSMFISNLILALSIKYNAHLWAFVTILTTYEDGIPKLISSIANCAYRYCGDEYVQELQEMGKRDEYDGFKSEEFVDFVDSLIKDPKEEPREFRFWVDDKPLIVKL